MYLYCNSQVHGRRQRRRRGDGDDDCVYIRPRGSRTTELTPRARARAPIYVQQ